MNTKGKAVVIGVAALSVVAGGVGVGLSYAAAPTPGAGATPSASGPGSPGASPAQRPAARPGYLLRRALHGEVTLAGPRHRVVDFQRGSVTKVSKDSFTVHSADGFDATYAVTSGTRVRSDGKPASMSAIATRDHVRVVALKDGSTLTARRVVEPRPR